MIEQPLWDDDIFYHARLQKELKTAICLDESIVSARKAAVALEIGACRIINIKVGRVGGFTEARKIHDICQPKIPVWCGGMLEIGHWTRAQYCAFHAREFRLARRRQRFQALLEGRHYRSRGAGFAAGNDCDQQPTGDPATTSSMSTQLVSGDWGSRTTHSRSRKPRSSSRGSARTAASAAADDHSTANKAAPLSSQTRQPAVLGVR